jgi:hypothetical protein
MTFRRPTVFVLALSSLALSAAAAAADNIRPGLWEFRSTRLSVGGLPDMSAQMAMLQQQLKNLPADTRRLLEQQMAQRGVSIGQDGTARTCITPEQARQDNVFSGKVEGNCTLSEVVRVGNTIAGKLKCTAPDANGSFQARIDSPEQFTTRVSMRSSRGDLDVETAGRWLAAQCAD